MQNPTKPATGDLLDFDDLKAKKISRSRAYRALGAGQLRAVKMGRRTFVTQESVTAYLAALPAATFRAPPA
jgi:hypothetical protein